MKTPSPHHRSSSNAMHSVLVSQEQTDGGSVCASNHSSKNNASKSSFVVRLLCLLIGLQVLVALNRFFLLSETVATVHGWSLVVENHIKEDFMKRSFPSSAKPSEKKTKKNLKQHLIALEKKPEEKRQKCRYNGHCPLGMTCGLHKQSLHMYNQLQELPGECQPIPIRVPLSKSETTLKNQHQQQETQQPHDQLTQTCPTACQTELEMDEHFYHATRPQIVQAHPVTDSYSQPRGCALDFVRVPETDTDIKHWTSLQAQDGNQLSHEPAPSIATWETTRFRHVIRVDPILEPQGHNVSFLNEEETYTTPLTWRAYCHAPCQRDDDCQTDLDTDWLKNINRNDSHKTSNNDFPHSWTCVNHACQRNPKFWEATLEETKSSEMVIVTGATANYFSSLQNLVASARYWAPRHRVVVYNLGQKSNQKLTSTMKSEIQSWSNVISLEWPDGVEQSFPKHVSVGKKYAWKPIIIEHALKKYHSIFWLDAGSTLTGPIGPVEDIVKRTGLFLVKGQDENMKVKSHPDSYKWFGFDKEKMQVGGHYAGNTQAYLYPSRYVDSIVKKNAACAWNETCVAPIGSELSNHRYDQTSLSICAYHPSVQAPHHTEYLSASEKDVHPNFQTPSFRFVWTARKQCRSYYNFEQEQQSSKWKKKQKIIPRNKSTIVRVNPSLHKKG